MSFDSLMQLVTKDASDKRVSGVGFFSDSSSHLTTDLETPWFAWWDRIYGMIALNDSFIGYGVRPIMFVRRAERISGQR